MGLSVIVLLSLLPLAARAEEPVTLDLPHAVDAAVRGATLVLKQANNEKIAGANLLQAYGSFLPDLRFTAGYDIASGTTQQAVNGIALFSSTSRGADYQLSSTLNIFRGFGDVSALDAATRRRDSARLTFERARQEIALDVTQSFLQSVLDDELTAIARKNLEVSQERLRIFRGQEKVGSLAAADVYRQEAQTAADEASFIGARNQAHYSLLDLLRRLRMDARKDYRLQIPELPVPASRPMVAENGAMKEAIRNRPDLLAREQDAKAANADVTHAASTYWPTLDLQGAFTGAGRVYSRDSLDGTSKLPATQSPLFDQTWNQHVASVALLFTWNIFTGFSTTAEVRRADAARDNAQIDQQDTQNQVVIEVKQAVDDINSAYDQLGAAQSGVRASQKAFELLRGRYRLGASSFLDLITAQTAVAQAEARNAQALVNYHLRLRALKVARGEDP